MHRKRYLYERSWKGEQILVICSFSEKQMGYRLPRGFDEEKAELLMNNYPSKGESGSLRPYEARIYRWQSSRQ